ncbi:MAG: FG-GAP repeat protein [Deltaproteobacteria bacterium]|nr:FG-GAP repeat protein [Deltaproteobacteria bacterium]
MRILALLGLVSLGLAATGGPDAGGYVYTDNAESNGPTHQWLDTSGGSTLFLADDELATLDLPFAFSFYGTSYAALTVSDNGALFFAGAQAAPITDCPGGSTSWTGIAAFADDLDGASLTYDTLGTYPYRSFVVTWEGAHATYGGSASVQVWLLEGRNEVVVALDDVDFGHPAVDGGANAIVGVSSGSNGLDWSCTTAFGSGSTAWFGDEAARPARATVYSSQVPTLYSDTAFAYAGSSIHAADLDGDGIDDMLVGAPDLAAGEVYAIYRPAAATSLLDAEASFQGDTTGDEFGSAVAHGDLDGDGTSDLAIGARGVAGTQSDAGATYVFAVEAFTGTVATSSAFLDLAGPPTGRGALGSSLALGDLDGDGYDDLLAAAPASDTSGIDAGEVLLLLGGSGLAGSFAAGDADARLLGDSAGDRLGSALAMADADLDGAAELVIGAINDDGGGSNAGAVYLVAGGSYAGSSAVSSVAACSLEMDQAGAALGTAVALADLDGSGLADLVVGAPGYDRTYTNGGRVLGYADVGLGCPALAGADFTVTGVTLSGKLGDALATGDLDGDGIDDLVAAATNDNTYSAAAGAAYAFVSMPTGDIDASSADHRIYGTVTSGALGSALALASDGERSSLLAGAPSAAGTYTGEGAVSTWSYGPDFEDDDGDGFVSADLGGNDCDDDDGLAYPAGAETLGDSTDGDCDGYIDDAVKVRREADYFDWDVAELGGTVSTTIDFETGAHGSTIAHLGGVTFTGAEANDACFGVEAVDSLAACVAGASLFLEFDEPVDALSLQLLDPSDSFLLTALDANGDTVVDAVALDISADDRPGGVYRSLTFAGEVSFLEIAADGGDSFGIDELALVNAADTDRDQDGQADATGDCDDGDASVYLGATELLGNGVDDDCDGVIDAGNVTTFGNSADWLAALAVDAETIDFEAITEGESVGSQYASLGATFDGSGQGTADVDGTSAVGARALGTSTSFGVSFTELQPGLAFTALDVDGTLTALGYVDGALQYTASLSPGAGQVFVGLGFDYGIDELVVTVSGDEFGADDVIFAALGLDDADGDGLTESEGDCDDGDSSALPGAEETWYDGVDSDCDGSSDYDQDGDGADAGSGDGSDCDDTSSDIGPGAEETWYDGVDSDCDGASDYDQDGDGDDSESHGGTDCDDTDATVNTTATETYYDGIDQDCAGDSDFDADADGSDGGGSGTFNDCDDTDPSVGPGADEVPYDGVDNDCDDATSDSDADGDGYDGEAAGGADCDDTSVFVYPGASGEACYDGEDTDCDGASDYDCDQDGYDSSDYGGTDCDDSEPAVNPAASDTFGDGIDSNCDGGSEFDNDGDGYDSIADGGTDCDDDDSSISPVATDICYDGVDSDCDGTSDNDCDKDGIDGQDHGGTDCDDDDATISPLAEDFPYDGIDHDCDGGSEYDIDGDGFDVDWYGGTDCDDADGTVYPGAIDACYDGLDTDCDAGDDFDCDADGYTAADHGGSDCDDSSDSVNPGAAEVADDGVDNDCDGAEATTCADCDGDGEDGLLAGGADCDDANAAVNTAATEVYYDGVDGNCDGADDFDQDKDGDRAEAQGGGDCDDADPSVGPHVALDDCGAGDEDCDGRSDEDCVTGGTGDSGDSGDTGDTDTGPGPDDTDTAHEEDWRPDPETIDDPKAIDDVNACGCDSGAGMATVGALAAAVLGARRRRR